MKETEEIEKLEKKLKEAKAIRHAVYVDLMAKNNQVCSVCSNK